jgi:hypothetical protein
MNKLTRKLGLLKRVRRKPELAVCAMAALLFLSGLAVPARAQNTDGGLTVIHTGSIGLVPGQSVSVTVPNSYFQDGSIKSLKSSVLKVYDREGHAVTERTSGLIYSGESGGLNEAFIFTFKHGDLAVPGEPRTDRIQVRIEITSAMEEQAEDRSAIVLPPTVELMDDADGKTVLLLSLATMSAQAQADGGLQLEMSTRLRSAFSGHISLAKGQTVRLSGPRSIAISPTTGKIFNSSDGTGVIVTGTGAPGGHVKVFSGSSGALLQSYELAGITAGLRWIDINRDDLREEGEPGTGRIPLWIQVVMDPCSADQQVAEECALWVVAPTFELINKESGRTTVHGPIRQAQFQMYTAR